MKTKIIAGLFFLIATFSFMSLNDDEERMVNFNNSWHVISYAAMEVKDYELAIRCYKKLLAEPSQSPILYYRIGIALICLNDYSAAEKYLYRGLELTPIDWEKSLAALLYKELAKIQKAKKNNKLSLEFFQLSKELLPSQFDIYREITELKAKTKTVEAMNLAK
jgi:tetratricopeptide (TPR) repeat protein